MRVEVDAEDPVESLDGPKSVEGGVDPRESAGEADRRDSRAARRGLALIEGDAVIGESGRARRRGISLEFTLLEGEPSNSSVDARLCVATDERMTLEFVKLGFMLSTLNEVEAGNGLICIGGSAGVLAIAASDEINVWEWVIEGQNVNESEVKAGGRDEPFLFSDSSTQSQSSTSSSPLPLPLFPLAYSSSSS